MEERDPLHRVSSNAESNEGDAHFDESEILQAVDLSISTRVYVIR